MEPSPKRYDPAIAYNNEDALALADLDIVEQLSGGMSARGEAFIVRTPRTAGVLNPRARRGARGVD